MTPVHAGERINKQNKFKQMCFLIQSLPPGSHSSTQSQGCTESLSSKSAHLLSHHEHPWFSGLEWTMLLPLLPIPFIESYRHSQHVLRMVLSSFYQKVFTKNWLDQKWESFFFPSTSWNRLQTEISRVLFVIPWVTRDDTQIPRRCQLWEHLRCHQHHRDSNTW